MKSGEPGRFGAAAALTAILAWQPLPMAAAAPPQHEVIDLATLVAKGEIADMLVDYYALFRDIAHGDWASYYAEDAVLDVNGIVAHGRGAISALYKTVPGGGNTHILISNQKIVVHGTAAATVDFIWTEIGASSHSAAPRLVEQGREHDELVKRYGRWYFLKRMVTSDAGLPPALEKTYKER